MGAGRVCVGGGDVQIGRRLVGAERREGGGQGGRAGVIEGGRARGQRGGGLMLGGVRWRPGGGVRLKPGAGGQGGGRGGGMPMVAYSRA